jgi:phosphinothricin acetyltransferase
MIRAVEEKDVGAIATIYNYYIAETTISFEEKSLSVEEMGARVAHIAAGFPYLVCEDDAGVVVGYAYVHTFRERTAYRFTVEDTVYVRHGWEGRGIGEALLRALIAATAQAGFHAVIACITHPNAASVQLHEKCGFAPLGIFRDVGYKFGQWLDVSYGELIFP